MAETLAPEVDFFSIGTNDLTQYTLAADRTNPKLASLTSAISPAVLRLIQNVIVQAHRLQKWVGYAANLQVNHLHYPSAIPNTKQIIHSLKLQECLHIASSIVNLESVSQVIDHVKEKIPWILGQEHANSLNP